MSAEQPSTTDVVHPEPTNDAPAAGRWTGAPLHMPSFERDMRHVDLDALTSPNLLAALDSSHGWQAQAQKFLGDSPLPSPGLFLPSPANDPNAPWAGFSMLPSPQLPPELLEQPWASAQEPVARQVTDTTAGSSSPDIVSDLGPNTGGSPSPTREPSTTSAQDASNASLAVGVGQITQQISHLLEEEQKDPALLSGGLLNAGVTLQPYPGTDLAAVIAAATAAQQAAGMSSTPVQLMPPAASGPASLSMLQKRQRSLRAHLTFEEYEAQYGPSAKCSDGACALHCTTPCKKHTCKSCKKHRQLDVVGKGKGYCGKCSRREKVEGLEFVRCCHTTLQEGGRTVMCGVEMLKDVFDNHWKQHRNEGAPAFQEVDTDEGRSCHACTNMRPFTYYPQLEGNCSCNHCTMVKTRGAAAKNPEKYANKDKRAPSPLHPRNTPTSAAVSGISLPGRSTSSPGVVMDPSVVDFLGPLGLDARSRGMTVSTHGGVVDDSGNGATSNLRTPITTGGLPRISHAGSNDAALFQAVPVPAVAPPPPPVTTAVVPASSAPHPPLRSTPGLTPTLMAQVSPMLTEEQLVNQAVADMTVARDQLRSAYAHVLVLVDKLRARGALESVQTSPLMRTLQSLGDIGEDDFRVITGTSRGQADNWARVATLP